jgi:DNA-binding MarR family transcriptional regulator
MARPARRVAKKTSQGGIVPRKSPAASGLQLGSIANQVGYRLRLLQIAAFKDFEEQTYGYGSAPRYFGLLSIIEANPGSQQSRLAEAIHLQPSSLVPILDKLQNENLVERRSSKLDRRSKSVWLTPEGARVLEQLRPYVEQHEKRLTRSFSASQKQLFLKFLVQADQDLRISSVLSSAA